MVENIAMLDHILNDETFGAGNFIYKLYQHVDIQDRQKTIIYLDQPFLDNDQQVITELSLEYIVSAADRYARYYAQMGIRAKDPVVLFFDESINYFLQFIALSSMGAMPYFLNSKLDDEIIVKSILMLNSNHMITNLDNANIIKSNLELKTHPMEIINLKNLKLPKTCKRTHTHRHYDDDVVLLAHTSGTTGVPKIVQFTHASMAFGIRKQIKKQPGKRVLSILPHSHAASMTVLMSSILRLVPTKIQVNKNPIQVLSAIEAYQPDVIVAFPKTFVDLCRVDLSLYNLDSIQYWLSTGDANHEPHIRQLIAQGHHLKNGIKKTGSMFIDNLGSTEFSYAMFRNMHTNATNNYNRCIGVPFDWVKCAVLDDKGEFLSINKVGYLGVMAKSVTKGYWNNSNLTEKNRINGYWLTGDLAYQAEDGLFYHVDRISDSIKTSNGCFYSCQAEEWILKNIPEIFEISFVGAKNATSHELVAFIEYRRDNAAVGTEDIRRKINYFLDQKKWLNVSQVKVEASDNNIGVTGKKLKRKIRTLLEQA